jgi:hypothetical protein
MITTYLPPLLRTKSAGNAPRRTTRRQPNK